MKKVFLVAAMSLCLYVFINEARPLIRSTPGPTRRMPVRGQLNRILKEETATKEEEGTTRRVVLVVYVAHPIALSSLAAVRCAYAAEAPGYLAAGAGEVRAGGLMRPVRLRVGLDVGCCCGLERRRYGCGC